MQSRKPGICLFAVKFRTSPSNVTIGNDYRVKLSQCLGKGKVTPDEEILRGFFFKKPNEKFLCKPQALYNYVLSNYVYIGRCNTLCVLLYKYATMVYVRYIDYPLCP